MVFIWRKPLKSREWKSRSPQQDRREPTDSALRFGTKSKANSQFLEAGDSSGSGDTVVSDKAEQGKISGKPGLNSHKLKGLPRQGQRRKRARGSRLLDFFKRKICRLRAVLGFQMQNQTHDQVGLDHGMEHDGPMNPLPKGAEYTLPHERKNPGDSRQQLTGGFGYQQADSGVFPRSDTGLETGRTDAARSQTPESPRLEPPSKHLQRPQDRGQEPTSTHDKQSPTRSGSNDPGNAPYIGIKTLETASSKESPLVKSSSSGEGRTFKRTFHMVIHLQNGESALRVGCLDTMAEVDAVSHQVVESLVLKKNEYFGPAVKPLGGYFEPKSQVTVDWHISGFHKTYTTTFVVLDEKHSGDFDVLLGHKTIEEIGFYEKNGRVWMLSANDPVECD
ncbi:MAG: hypothetical protein Q9216_004723 [Gyalolechia sp. 2 TL-2023]